MNREDYILSLEQILDSIFKEIISNKTCYSSIDGKAMITLGYYSRIIENSKAILILIKENNLTAPIMSLMRCILEGYIDLYNILNVEGYIEYLYYVDLKNKNFLSGKEHFRKVSSENGYDYVTRKKKINNEMKKLEEQLGNIKTVNYFFNNKINTSVSFKFKLAKSISIYDTLYWISCNDTHGNITTSIESHYINKDGKVTAFNEMKLEEVERIIITLNSILNESRSILHKVIDIN